MQVTAAVAAAVGLAAVLRVLLTRRHSRVYLVDYALAKPPESWKFPKANFIPASAENPVSGGVHSSAIMHWCRAAIGTVGPKLRGDCFTNMLLHCNVMSQQPCQLSHLPHVYCCHLQKFSADDLEFQHRILYRSGLGEDTYVPPCESYSTSKKYLHQMVQAIPLLV